VEESSSYDSTLRPREGKISPLSSHLTKSDTFARIVKTLRSREVTSLGDREREKDYGSEVNPRPNRSKQLASASFAELESDNVPPRHWVGSRVQSQVRGGNLLIGGLAGRASEQTNDHCTKSLPPSSTPSAESWAVDFGDKVAVSKRRKICSLWHRLRLLQVHALPITFFVLFDAPLITHARNKVIVNNG
jgi:hypothetical protein